jgi:hypothetical protein
MQNSYGAFVFSYICNRDPNSIPISSVDSHFSDTVHEVRKIHGSDGNHRRLVVLVIWFCVGKR